ncbi:MAG: FAD-dependent oxidoreductase [Novosphingobium sp.]|nr:FAD-dependent oxidoreductase [Novosphingobium sp.]
MTRPLKNMCEISVIGGGLAGLSAAYHAARLGRLVTLFEGTGMYGGQVATVEEVDGLGVPGHFTGQDVAINLLDQARKIGVQIVESPVASLDNGAKLTITDEGGMTYHPDSVIVASGASLRKLGVPGEEEFAGRGVSRCATCDGGFFRGQDVAVIGGGDAAVTEALVLTRMSGKVLVISRSPLRAKRDYIDKLDSKANVEFVWDSEVTAVLGSDEVTGLRLRNVRSGEETEVPCSGVFPFIGVEPNSAFMPASLVTPTGHIETASDLSTPDPRIFAVGAVRAGYGGNVSQAMSEGISAAEAAARLLAK